MGSDGVVYVDVHQTVATRISAFLLRRTSIFYQVEKLDTILPPETDEPQISHSGRFHEKRDFGQKPKSLLDPKWCRRGDSNPHGFPHHPLKPL
jgi:hypothetical protein